MTPEERERILDAVSTVDGGCGTCIRDLLETLAALLPEVPWEQAFADGEGPYSAKALARRKRARDAVWTEPEAGE